MNCLPFESLSRRHRPHPQHNHEHSRCGEGMMSPPSSSCESSSRGRENVNRLRGAFSTLIFSLRNVFFHVASNNVDRNDNIVNSSGSATSRRKQVAKKAHRHISQPDSNVKRRRYCRLPTVHEDPQSSSEREIFTFKPLLANGDKNNNAALATRSSSTCGSTSTPMSDCTVDLMLSSPSEMDEDDSEWDDEDVTCNVCDRSFATPRLLERHQQKRRHWCCNACERLFDSLMLLEHHKEEYDHWSSDDGEEDDYSFEDVELDEEAFRNEVVDNEETLEKLRWQRKWRRRRLQDVEEYEETQFGPTKVEESILLL